MLRQARDLNAGDINQLSAFVLIGLQPMFATI